MKQGFPNRTVAQIAGDNLFLYVITTIAMNHPLLDTPAEERFPIHSYALPPAQQGPLKVGPVTLHSRVMLAPMAGVTDVVFRDLVRQQAPQSLICTEMISSNGLVYSKKTSARIMDKGENDHPIAYQLAANKPEVLLEAAQTIIAEKNPDTIDLNMGCPVKKITGNFEGCSLMKSPAHAEKLIRYLVDHIDKPVTVKFRLGWDNNSINFKEFGQMCEAAGVKMVTLHARTRAQGYGPNPRWEAFGELKQAVNIPVIANGDILSVGDALHIFQTYGVDGVMIGRGCLGQPWLLGDIDHALTHGTAPPERTLAEKMTIALAHTRAHCAYRDGNTHTENVGIREMRKHLSWYAKGFKGASAYRHQFSQVASLEEVEHLIAEIIEKHSPSEGVVQSDNARQPILTA